MTGRIVGGMRGIAGGLAVLAGVLAGRSALGGWDAPARFEVTSTVLNPDVSAWTATMADGPVNSWLDGGAFEPMVFRRKFHARGDAADEILLPRSEIDGYNSYRDGLLDGAAVRVYRIEDGAFRKVREDTVAHFYSSGWYAPEGMDWGSQLLPSTATVARVNWPSWYRKPADYHFKVVAVGTGGLESTDSNIATVPWNGWTAAQVPQTNALVSFAPPATPSGTMPSAPTNLQAGYDPVGGLITLSWNAVPPQGLAGYRLYYCDRDPAALNGFRILLANSPSDPDQHIRTGDMVFLEMTRTSWDKREFLSHRVFNTSQAGGLPTLVPYHNDAVKGWAFVPHPAPVPAALAAVGGQTCLELTLGGAETVQLAQYNHAHLQQDWYNVLQPGKTYVVEVWLRQEGLANGTAMFDLTGFYATRVPAKQFAVTGQWQKFVDTFTVNEVYTGPGAVGQMRLRVTGPGRVWVDNFRVYEQGTGYLELSAEDRAALQAGGIGHLRTHSHIKSGWGHTMEDLTNPRGVIGPRGWQGAASQHTLDSLLTLMRDAGIDPWLQTEMYMTEAEWLGWVEYLAAPYDPAVDSRATKPWAAKRHAQGQTAPWTDAFGRILFEISNETWNSLFVPWTFMGITMPDHGTGGSYGSGQLYGLWQEYVVGILRSSPYWTPAVEAKFEFVLGGWSTQATTTGYGAQAAQTSPVSDHMTLAGYNGGWDEGEPPAEATDEGRFKTLTFAVQAGEPTAIQHVQTRDALRAQGLADYHLGTYEAGPGYNLNGLNGVSMTDAQVEAESRVMKSLAGGTATLDSFLMNAKHGYRYQNFFTFSRNRHYWVSHARWEKGSQAYPCWDALALHNLYGAGDHLQVHALAVPSWDLPKTLRRAARPAAPMVGVYATRQGARVAVFCLSRKLDGFPVAGDDGFTPLTLRLPFALAPGGTITLHRMVGDPRAHNLDAALIVPETIPLSPAAFAPEFTVDATRGADARGLPPGATFVYVFDGVEPAAVLPDPQARVEQAYDQDDPCEPGTEGGVAFGVFFDRPVQGFGDSPEDVLLGGNARAGGHAVAALAGSGGTAYRVTVGPVENTGALTLSVPAGAATSVADGRPNAASTSDDNRVYVLVPGTVDLQQLFDAAGVGGTVLVEPGLYAQDVTVSNALQVAWQDVVLDGVLTLRGSVALTFAGHARVEELRLDVGSAACDGLDLVAERLVLGEGASLAVVDGTLTVGTRTLTGTFILTEGWDAPPVPQPLPFADGFEAYGVGQPLALLGPWGWSAASGDARVVSEVPRFGQREALLPRQTETEVWVDSAETRLWTDLWVLPPPGAPPEDSPGSDESVRMYVTAGGHVALWRAGAWDACAADAFGGAVPSVGGRWARVSLLHDYAARDVAVFLDGRLLRMGVPFVGAEADRLRRLTFRNAGGDTGADDARLDQVSVRTTLPEGLERVATTPDDTQAGCDGDGDGMSDALELHRYGSLTTYNGPSPGSVMVVR